VAPILPGGYLKSMRLGNQDVLTEEMMIRPSTATAEDCYQPPCRDAGRRRTTGNQPTRRLIVLAPDGKFRQVTSFYRIAAADERVTLRSRTQCLASTAVMPSRSSIAVDSRSRLSQAIRSSV